MSVSQLWFGSPAPAGPSTSEKQAYYTSNLAAAKAGTYTGRQIKPGVELLPGWKPWDGLGVTTGWEIAAAIARNGGDDLNSIVPGDWFTVDEPESTTDIKTTKYECNGRDLYYVEGDKTNGRHHFTFVPDTLWKFSVPWNANNSNDWATSTVKSYMEQWLAKKDKSLQSSVLQLNIPFTDYQGKRTNVPSKVFPPSEYETFGNAVQSRETPTGQPPYRPYVLLSRSRQDRIKSDTGYYHLRSTRSGTSHGVVTVANQATADVERDQHIYAQVSNNALELLCINIG